jgi:multiple sugar transport system substrate-binding protein
MRIHGARTKSRKPRRLTGGLAALTALSLALAGCGSSDSGSGDGDGDITLTVSVWNLDKTPEFQALFDAFEDANPEITIKPLDILADDYADKVSTMLAGGDSTDVITLKNVTDYARYSNRNQLLEVTDVADSTDRSNLAGLEAFESDGSYYGLPYRQDFWLLYYNKELFDEAGLDHPENLTWEEYADLAGQLSSGSGGDQVFGTYHHTWRSVIQAVSAAQTGGDQLGGDYGFFTDQYEIAKGLQDSGDTLDFGTATSQQATYNTMFETGKAAMLPMGTWYAAALLKAKASGDTDVEWGMAPMPQRAGSAETVTFGSPTGFGVNKGAKNPETAKKFLEFAIGPQGAEAIASIGVVPALQTPELLETYFALDGMPGDDLSALAFQPDQVVLEMPVSEHTSDIDTILNEEHQLIMVGEKSIEDGVQSMGKRVHDEVLD